MSLKRLALTCTAAMLLAGTVAFASQIFIQQSGSSPAGGDPNLITNSGGFVVGSAGSHDLQNPLLVIVGVYDGMGTPSISFSGCATPSACSAAPLTTYGLTADTASFTAASNGTAFAQLGLTAGGSESFVNWSAGDVAAGFAAPTSFSLFAFALPVSVAGMSTITVDESGAANGSYIIAYDCADGTGSSSGCAKRGDVAETVFTNTGLLDAKPTPEPGSMLLFGSSLLTLGSLIRRRFRKEG